MARRTMGWALVGAILAAGCTVSQKRAAVEKATDDPERRREAFEATLRVLDENPEYVDEFFRLALVHRPTLERFLHDTVAELERSRWLPEATARELARDPKALQRILVETLDASRGRRPAEEALLAAMRARKEPIAGLLASDPDTMKALMGALAGAEAEGLRAALKGLLDAEPAKPGR
jgi:hypothetical protein